MSKEFPRSIDASLIEIGDRIHVTRNLGNGIVQTLTGVVAEREDRGQTRVYRTAEGGVLVAWEPHRAVPRVTLIYRAPAPQVPLWDEDDDVRRRVS